MVTGGVSPYVVASTREASTAAAARLSAKVVAERETGGGAGWQGNGSRAHHVQEERRYQEDHLGGKYPGGEPERYQYALELRPNTCRDG